MDVELHNFIKVWTLAIMSFCYCFYISARLPKGFFRLISLLPIFFLFIILPLNISSFHFCGPTSFFLAWLANFKLLLFSFDQGPLSPLPPNLFHFISIASLPIKTKPNIENHPNMKKDCTPNQNISHFPESNPVIKKLQSNKSSKSNKRISYSNYSFYSFTHPYLLAIKVLLLAILFHSYNYTQHLHKNVVLAMYCVHTYLELELLLALSAMPARAVFGFEIEPQFNEPYLATSLQDFWGHRWNLMVTSILRPTVYYPIRRISTHIVGTRWVSLPAVLAVFVVSGLMHEVIYYYLTRVHPTWEVTLFFILQGVATAMEVAVKKVVPAKWLLHPAVSRPLTLGFVAVTGVWLFFPQLVRNRVDERAIGEYSKLLHFLRDVLPYNKH